VDLRDIARRYSKRYIVKRLSTLLVALFAVLFLNFLLPHLMPGNFVQFYVESLSRQHPGINLQAFTQRIIKLYGLDAPLYGQFLQYLRDVITPTPNFGPSLEFYPLNAWTIVQGGVVWTLLLLGISQLISWVLGIFLGTFMAFRKGKIVDKVLQPSFFFLNSIPLFWLGLILVLVFSIDLRMLPATGAYTLYPTFTSILTHLILPVAVIVIGTLPSHALVIRSAALDVLSSDFVQASKAQGLRGFTLLSLVLKNSLLPSLTQLFLSIGYLIGGIYTVEVVFSYPGMGTVIYQAIITEDYPVIQAALYLTALVVILANLAADLTYPIIDPRVSYA
jgi:peptide/nickel transport system permease protein